MWNKNIQNKIDLKALKKHYRVNSKQLRQNLQKNKQQVANRQEHIDHFHTENLELIEKEM